IVPRNDQQTSISGALAASMSTRAGRAYHPLSPARLSIRPVSVWVRLSIGHAGRFRACWRESWEAPAASELGEQSPLLQEVSLCTLHPLEREHEGLPQPGKWHCARAEY